MTFILPHGFSVPTDSAESTTPEFDKPTFNAIVYACIEQQKPSPLFQKLNNPLLLFPNG